MSGIEIRDAVVVITGGAGGIGTALADAFRRAGAVVVTTDLAGRGADIDLDVTDAAAVSRVVGEVHERHGRLDIVIANAGIGVAGLATDLDAAAWQRTIDVNISGTVNTVRAALPLLVARKSGSIVLVASVAGLVGTPLLTPYSMSKAAIVGLAESLRPEAAISGVGVTLVCPGPTETPLLDEPAATPGMSVRRYLTASAGKPLAATMLGELVLDAVRTNAAMVLPGRAALLWRLDRMVPGVVRRVVAKGMRDELKAAARPG